MSQRCAIPGCRSRRKNSRLFLGPYNEKTRWETWKKACPFLENYDHEPKKLQRLRFCYKHFYPEHINEQNKLTREAIPVLNLQFEGFTDYWQYLEELVGSEPMSQLIDDDMLLYGSKPHHSRAAQDTLTEKTNEVLEELKCNLCDNIIKAPKDEIEDGPKPKHEEGDPLLANFNPAGTTSQLLTVHECLDTGATESEEGEPPQKRPAFSPFEPLQTPTTFTLETTQASSAKENQILLQIMPHKSRNKRKLYIPVPDRPKQMHVQTQVQTSTRPIILRRTPKDKSLPLNRSTQQGHSSETLVSTQILAENRICNLIVKNSKTSIRPSNIIVQDNRTPITPSHVIVQDNKTPITPSHVIVHDNRTLITPGNIIVQGNRTPITPSPVIIQDNRRSITPGNNRPRR